MHRILISSTLVCLLEYLYEGTYAWSCMRSSVVRCYDLRIGALFWFKRQRGNGDQVSERAKTKKGLTHGPACVLRREVTRVTEYGINTTIDNEKSGSRQ